MRVKLSKEGIRLADTQEKRSCEMCKKFRRNPYGEPVCGIYKMIMPNPEKPICHLSARAIKSIK